MLSGGPASTYLLHFESTAHQRSHAADLAQRLLAVDVGTPRQVPQDAGYHLETTEPVYELENSC